MGITALWEVIKNEDHSVPMAQLAEDHFKRTGSPLRIAVDEADWRHNNLTPQQVHMIRQVSNEPAFQGIEKAIFYRLCRLLTLNVRLLFVFDGPGRPWKRGRRGGNRVNYEESRLLKEFLRYLGIPYHEAPGEAEAECARLQQFGIVDAVFSQDSDTLMFGCTMLIRDDRVAKEKGNNDRSKENTKKSGTSVRVIHGKDIQERHNFDRQGLVLFAMLCGGDYDTTGLPGCGPALAIGAVGAGLGASLCECRTKMDCVMWRSELSAYFQTRRGRQPPIPPDFPNIKTLEKYYRPKVSTMDQFLKFKPWSDGRDAAIAEVKLLDLTSSRFNMWGKLYMNWIGPVLLTKYLVARDAKLPQEHVHQIRMTRQRATKATDPPVSQPLLSSLTFSPFSLTSLSRKDFENERAGFWTGKMEDPFDPEFTVKTEIPRYLLQKVLPSDVLSPPIAPKKKSGKRKRQPEEILGSDGPQNVEETHVSLAKRPTVQEPCEGPSHPRSFTDHGSSIQRPMATQERSMARDVQYVSLLSDSEEEDPPSQTRSSAIDRWDSWADFEAEEEDLTRAIQLSLRESATPNVTMLSPDRSWSTHSGSIARQRGTSSSQNPDRRPSTVTASTSTPSRFDRSLESVAISADMHGLSTRPSPATEMSSPGCVEDARGSNADEVRAARLRFFTSDNTEARTISEQHPVAARGNPQAAPRSIPLDIDFIDLT